MMYLFVWLLMSVYCLYDILIEIAMLVVKSFP